MQLAFHRRFLSINLQSSLDALFGSFPDASGLVFVSVEFKVEMSRQKNGLHV